ncbi:MAG TPA: hypothetical protein VGR76_11065, partial [Candidatus Angelobacter sp.]|nr:hypothetical protein [Candidatus Angelobacter sp.]
WQLVFGKVFQIQEGGFLFHRYSLSDLLMEHDSELIFVRNEPHAKTAVDGEDLIFFAEKSGRFSYVTTQSAQKTIAAFDYGIVCTNEAPAVKIEKQINILEEILRKSGTHASPSFETNADGVMCTFKCSDAEDRGRVRDAVMDFVGAYSGTVSPPVITFKLPSGSSPKNP